MATSSSFVSTTRALLAGLALGAAASVLAAHSSVADVDDFSFESFDAHYVLGKDDNQTPTLEIREVLVALFPDYDQNRGIARAIPLWYGDQPLHPEVEQVGDGSGGARVWSSYEDGEFLWVESVVAEGEFVRGRQVYEIDYTVDNPIRDYSASSGYQELYWDINGNGWPQKFGRVSVTLLVPADLASGLSTDGLSCYVGDYGATSPCSIEVQEDDRGDVVIVASHADVGPYQTVTIAVPFAPGTFSLPTRSYWASPLSWLQVIGAVISLIALGRVLWLRRGILADAPGRPVIVPEYVPPQDVTVVEGAIVLGQQARVMQAALLELAVSGAAVLVQDTDRPREWSIQRSATPLLPHQTQLLEVLWGNIPDGEETRALPRQSSRVADRLGAWLGKTRQSMTSEDFYRRVGIGQRLSSILTAGVAMMIGLVAAVNAMEQRYGPVEVAALGALTVVATALTLVLSSRRPLGQKGADTRDHLAGLSLYIELAEADRLAYLQSPKGALRTKVNPSDTAEVITLYERLLPWAVLLGHEKRWLAELDRLYREDHPRWIVGPVGSLSHHVSQLGVVAKQAAASSSSGGSSGGGSAGGGGGGGGGGGR